MIKILHIMPGADLGGISTVVLNYYRYIDKSRFHFDIALTTNKIGLNGKEFLKLGSNIYYLPLKSNNIKQYKIALKNLILNNKYDVLHVHENETSYIALSVAKKLGIKCRIAHSHTTSPFLSIKGELRRLSGVILNSYYATTLIGCGKLAGERVFGKYNMKKSKAIILPNAIDTDKFKYNENVRLETREELGIKNQFVVGMVGRLDVQKNSLYAIELFKSIYKEINDAILIIVGDGPLKEKLMDAICNSGISQNIKYLGKRKDVERLYQAFDVLILPSLYEGFPICAVEAMAAGLPVLMSDKITRELNFCENIHYLPLDDKTIWVKTAANYYNDIKRKMRKNEIIYAKYDIKNTAKILQDVYSIACSDK